MRHCPREGLLLAPGAGRYVQTYRQEYVRTVFHCKEVRAVWVLGGVWFVKHEHSLSFSRYALACAAVRVGCSGRGPGSSPGALTGSQVQASTEFKIKGNTVLKEGVPDLSLHPSTDRHRQTHSTHKRERQSDALQPASSVLSLCALPVAGPQLWHWRWGHAASVLSHSFFHSPSLIVLKASVSHRLSLMARLARAFSAKPTI